MEDYHGWVHGDAYAGNIAGALYYGAKILERAPKKEQRLIGEGLMRLYENLRYSTGHIPDEFREKIANYLNDNNVLELLDDIELYLKH